MTFSDVVHALAPFVHIPLQIPRLALPLPLDAAFSIRCLLLDAHIAERSIEVCAPPGKEREHELLRRKNVHCAQESDRAEEGGKLGSFVENAEELCEHARRMTVRGVEELKVVMYGNVPKEACWQDAAPSGCWDKAYEHRYWPMWPSETDI